MRRVFVASLLVAGFAGTALSHRNNPLRRRKTLGFGPEHPNAVFHSSPYDIQTNAFLPMSPGADPFDVADRFVRDILGTKLTESMAYRIREDSYTDSSTGVTHVYIRQFVNGLEVTNGDMNVNIKDGVVLSYGTSFYDGQVPRYVGHEDTSLMTDPHRDYCDILSDHLDSSRALNSYGDQQTLTDPHRPEIHELSHIHSSNCRHQNLPYELSSSFHSSADISDFRHALLQFMVAATPKDDVVEDILSNFDKHLNELVIEAPTGHFAPTSPMDVLVSNVPDTVNPVKARLAYIQVPSKDGDGTHLAVVWRFEVEMQDNWYEAAVSATAPHRIISVVDWASDAPIPTEPELPAATYNVFVWGLNDPTEGGRSLEKENFDALASPAGWHALPHSHDPSFQSERRREKDFWRNTTTTWGNNVFAQENWEGRNSYINNYRPDAGKTRSFAYKYSPQETDNDDALDEAKKFINNTISQLFYTTNMVHDLYYRYGFTEVSGNFQQYNFGRGGGENDAVIANAQDGSGYNNANFMTPPDGQNGRMRMYLWNTANPYRDGDLEAGIVIHELSHGLSTRLTGGPANSGCLGWGESGGMGEGWGDFLATTIRSTKVYSDYAMGAWAANQERGIRNFVYSMNDTVNPSTYKTLDKPGYWGVHAIGEVWAEILWVVSQGLIKKHGFSDNLFPPQPDADGTVPTGDFYRPSSGNKPLVPKHGNSLMVQLVLNGMKLQTCRPSFFDARDAIIQADQVLTGGENFCTLWEGFSSRGLGLDAKVEGRTPWGGGIRANGFSLPLVCQ
ncbi:Extracellular elastinolytic metalloproteinase [Termitomyces sp. T112]|nr:Extracellular elastinolytic metalloproteinase [Termitomyces sp. T112]